MPNQDEFRVGLASAYITPAEPIRMGGYGGRNTPSKGVLDPLRADAIAFEDTAGERAVLVTLDLIGMDAAYAEVVFKAIHEATGLERRQVIINYSHTHAGPIFGLRYQQSWGLSDDERAAIERYNDTLCEQIVIVVQGALEDLVPARLSWATGAASINMSRRKPTAKGVVNAPNPRGYADRSVPVLRAADPAGNLLGVVFGYSCHNTTLGGKNLMISANYAGFAQRWIERHFRGATAMFVQGCGGDANPYPRGTYALCRQHGETLGAEVQRLMEEEWDTFEPVRGPLRIAFDHVDLPLEPPPPAEELERMRAGGGYYAGVAERIQALIDSDKPWATHYRTPIAVWQFGDDLTLVRLSGEVVSDYIKLCEQAIGPLKLWVAGYCADYHGYLPSARVYHEGGYEARDFITGWGYLDPGCEAATIAKVKELAQRVGRDVEA